MREREDQSNWRRRLTSSASAWVPVLAYMGLLFGLSAQARLPEVPGVFLSWDKSQHLLGYAGLMMLAYRAVVLKPVINRPSGLVQAFSITIGYGALDEFHQMFVPGRSGELYDWLADVSGAALGVLLIVVFLKLTANGGRAVVGNR